MPNDAGHIFAVLACDLDRFKAVNDSLGHPAGDSLLRAVAERLTSVIHEGDTVARLGGDEFAIVLREPDLLQTATTTAQQVIEALQSPFDLGGRSVSVGVSIGIAVGPQDGGDPDQLFKNADIALYRAKAAGRNTFRFYEPGMDAAIAARNVLELDLREAVRLGQFELYYQPIIELATDTTSGFEALMRWRHPVKGLVSPADFIPLAEETGLIVPPRQLGPAGSLPRSGGLARRPPGGGERLGSAIHDARPGALRRIGFGRVRSEAGPTGVGDHRERAHR